MLGAVTRLYWYCAQGLAGAVGVAGAAGWPDQAEEGAAGAAAGAAGAAAVGAAVGAAANAVLAKPLGEIGAKTYRVSGPWKEPKVEVISREQSRREEDAAAAGFDAGTH